LRDGSLRERDKLAYILTGAVFGSLYGRFRARPWSSDLLLVDAAAILVILLGITWCYRMNQRGDGRHFVERFAILSVPVGVGMAIVFYGIYYLLGVSFASVGQLERWSSTSGSIIAALVTLLLTYVWLARLIARAAKSGAA
jgi:hypothetical protein